MTTRIRMKFSKTGRIRFLSHLDFMTVFHRAVVRAGVPIAFSQGFNPHPKIAFGPALSVGMESEMEFFDMETDPFIDLFGIMKALNSSLPEGVRILESRIVPSKTPSLSGSIGRYVYEVEVPAPYGDGIEKRMKDFLARASIVISKDGKQKDIRPGIESVTITKLSDSANPLITLVDQEQLKPRVQDVIEQLFGIGQEQAVLFRVKRVGMYCKEKDRWISPMEV